VYRNRPRDRDGNRAGMSGAQVEIARGVKQ
jgi:hypothetical protein